MDVSLEMVQNLGKKIQILPTYPESPRTTKNGQSIHAIMGLHHPRPTLAESSAKKKSLMRIRSIVTFLTPCPSSSFIVTRHALTSCSQTPLITYPFHCDHTCLKCFSTNSHQQTTSGHKQFTMIAQVSLTLVSNTNDASSTGSLECATHCQGSSFSSSKTLEDFQWTFIILKCF